MESTIRDIQRVTQIRACRVQAVQLSSTANLAQVLASPKSYGAVYLVKLLDVHPSLGKVVCRRLMETLGLPPFVTVAELDASQQAAVLSACGEKNV